MSSKQTLKSQSMRKILITGSRTWTDQQIIKQALFDAYQELKPKDLDAGQTGGVTLISGNCFKGADKICEEIWSEKIGELWISRQPADWENYGKRAGFVRNSQMVAMKPDLCLAFIKDNSKGASMTAELAQKAGIKTIIYRT